MRCELCGASLGPVFPGGSVRCACGHLATVEVPSPGAQPTPYRTVGAAAALAPTVACPLCAAPVDSAIGVCATCSVDLATLRCPGCLTLDLSGSRRCAKCGHELPLPKLFDPEGAPCPACDSSSLERVRDEDDEAPVVHRCTRCGGIFVRNAIVAELVRRFRVGSSLPAPVLSTELAATNERAYARCPLCHRSMQRRAFERSGVVLDTCILHGHWFDAGELGRVLAYASEHRVLPEAPRPQATLQLLRLLPWL